MKSYVVIGLEMFGLQTAVGLYEQGQEVLVIDSKEEVINENANRVSRAIIADATKREVLKQLGVDKYDCAIVSTKTSDLATLVLITVNLKALGLKEIICRAKDETDKEVLEALGATMVIIPERLAADRLCKKLVQPNVLESIAVSDKYGIVEIEMPKSWVGKSIIDLNIRAKYGANIIAIKNGDNVMVTFDPSAPLNSTEVLVLVGDNKSLRKIQEMK